jgi:hypothetical protein
MGIIQLPYGSIVWRIHTHQQVWILFRMKHFLHGAQHLRQRFSA